MKHVKKIIPFAKIIYIETQEYPKPAAILQKLFELSLGNSDFRKYWWFF